MSERGASTHDLHDIAVSLPEVIVIHTPGLDDKDALVQDERSPFFTTPHVDGYRAVLIRERDLHLVSVDELREIITDAWAARAPKRLAKAFLDRESR
ncbi:hypothetical protein [Luteipulveratus halotolerans]|uniref:hypothetical protein n=1 Tax=Luteipulveratus halotolerans TaxID=1631356 RepID=UPI000680B7EC|nr:hypothetical protein [Luteipulveratus halotolerans]